MILRYVEVTNDFNHGKFLVGIFEKTDWDVPAAILGGQGLSGALLRRCGWGQEHFLLFDLQTGEGAVLRHGGMPKADLDKHQVWVCPMYEPFLAHLYSLSFEALVDLPAVVELPDAPSAQFGYRRPGPWNELLEAAEELLGRIEPGGLGDVHRAENRLQRAIDAIKETV